MILRKTTRAARYEQVLKLPYPPTANNLFANRKLGGRYKTKKYQAWISEAGWKLREQRPIEMTGPVEIQIVAVKPDGRRRDIANLEKPLMDLLVSHRVIEDDSCVQLFSMAWTSSDIAEGVSVTIWEYRPDDAKRQEDKSKNAYRKDQLNKTPRYIPKRSPDASGD